MASSTFDSCLSFVLKWEGGFSNDPRDTGGATNMGVTIATLSQELGHGATVADVRNMTRDTAAAIYRKRYWNTIRAYDLPAGVDLIAFDIAVNSGTGRALNWLQMSANLPARDRICWLDAKRRSFWRSLTTWAFFGTGWTRREDACLALALAMQGSGK